MPGGYNTNTELPPEITEAQKKASSLLGTYGEMKAQEPSVTDVLRQKVQQLYAENQDVIKPLDEATKTYYSAPSVAREKYQDIFNPFQRESLVSEYVGKEALPMLSLSSVLGQRFGRIDDLVGAGTKAFQAQVASAATKYEQAREHLADLLEGFKLTEGLKQQTFENVLAREKFAFEKSKPSGGGTLAERLEPSYQKAINAAQGGATLSDLQRDYGSKLGTDEVVRVYTANSPYGAPTEDYARKVLGLEAEEESSQDKPFWQKASEFFGIY